MRPLILNCRVEGDRPEVINEISFYVLERAISRLDGRRYNSLVLSTLELPSVDRSDGLPDGSDVPEGIIIVGGASGRVVVSHFTNGEPREMWWLALPERGDRKEAAVVGGQNTELPARWWVNVPTATHAAGYYLEHQERDPGLTWEPDPSVGPIKS